MTAATTIERDAPRSVHAPIDPHVKLPPGVLAASAKAEAAHAAMYNPQPSGDQPQGGAPVDGGPPVASAAAPVAAQSPAAPAAVAPAASVDTLAVYEPGYAPPAAAPAAAPAPVAGDDASEQRFRSMQGRFNAQLRQMQTQMADMGNELVAAQTTIEQLRSGARPAPQQPHQSLITDKDRTDYGDDFLDVAARAAQEALAPVLAAAQNETRQTRQELHQLKMGKVYEALSANVGGNWRNVNRHPRFSSWLDLRDPISGVMRRQLLDGAMQAADAARVVNIFRGFLADDAADRPASPAPQPSPAPVNPAAGLRQPAVNVLDLAAPGRASAAPGSPPATEKPNYTRPDIDAFYANVRRGKFAGREAEKQAIEADIFAAQREGRVR